MAEAWFQKEEYSTLRKEVENCMAELGTLEKAVVGGVAAIFAWVAKDGSSTGQLAFLTWIAPSVIAIYGGLKARAIASHLDLLGSYLRIIEKAQLPLDSKIQGWESYLEKNGVGKRSKVARGAWFAFILLTLLGSYIGIVHS